MNRKMWLTRLPAVTVAVIVVVMLAAALVTRPTLGAFTAKVSGDNNVAATGVWEGLLDTLKETSAAYEGIYLFQLGGGDPPALQTAAHANLAQGSLVDPLLSQSLVGYNNRARAELITDAPWPMDDPYALRFSKDSAGSEYFYTRDGLLEGLTGALLTGYKDQFSQEVWFRTTEPGVLFAYTRPGGLLNRPMSSYRLDVRTDGRLEYAVRDSGFVRPAVDSVISSVAVDDGQWHQAVTTFNFADHAMELYVDGRLVASQNSAVTPEVPGLVGGLLGDLLNSWEYRYGGDFDVSGYNSGLGDAHARQFSGDIAFVAGYAEVLPADVISEHAGAGLVNSGE